MRTFHIETLGCKVNHYETEQMATLLRSRGLIAASVAEADLCIVHSCSVTVEAASKSRSAVRRGVRLSLAPTATEAASTCSEANDHTVSARPNRKIIATGCWATGDPDQARAAGADAVITHRDDPAAALHALLDQWQVPRARVELTQLHHRQENQRAFLKVQDGCDAHCTYCIIPKLRSTLSSKPIDDAVAEAIALTQLGHVELVLTGIFLGAFGHATALRRRQSPTKFSPLAELIEALCTRVPGLRRLRISSLEPGDCTPALLATMASHPQVTPHLHLPLQSGSDRILHRMNRQYSAADYRELLTRVGEIWDRPAITTDVIVGFPGETDDDFAATLDLVNAAKCVHVHAFGFSPRPGTAAARWKNDFIDPRIVRSRMDQLRQAAERHSLALREIFVGKAVEVLVERQKTAAGDRRQNNLHHGRCERYFDVHFESESANPGDLAVVRIDRVTPARTHGTLLRTQSNPFFEPAGVQG